MQSAAILPEPAENRLLLLIPGVFEVVGRGLILAFCFVDFCIIIKDKPVGARMCRHCGDAIGESVMFPKSRRIGLVYSVLCVAVAFGIAGARRLSQCSAWADEGV